MPDPLVTALQPGPPASGLDVARSLAQSLAPEEALNAAPPWLLPDQARSFRRVLAAIRRHGGALLADPVGSGKTYVSLAVAEALNRGPTACLVPATLVPQWACAAARLGIPVRLCSHEQASRGILPRGTRGLVLIDESHHFRNPHTRRYAHTAAWLVGRAALLITATPVVNRALDLAAQLLLTVPDDVLLLDGIVSLRTLLHSGGTITALGQLVIEGKTGENSRPRVVRSTSTTTRAECLVLEQTLERLSRLRLSRCEPIAALLRTVLLRSAGSSPAALHGALCRYRGLLLHGEDARRSGKTLDRAELRRFTGLHGNQLVWWELMPSLENTSDLDYGDLNILETLIPAVRKTEDAPDGKLARLSEVLSDGIPTLVFTTFRETVRYIRDRSGGARLAWCTGEYAGIAGTRLRRQDVLGWFRHAETSPLAPRHLVVTDVAAEGLDLQRAGRIVHYDLPWTPMRLEQREGRSVRYGSGHMQIEVVQFAAAAALERSLGLTRTLIRKGQVPGRIGLGPAGAHVWRWRDELAARFSGPAILEGTAHVTSSEQGLLAGFGILRKGDRTGYLSTSVIWMEPNGRWSESPDVLSHRLDLAARESDVVPVNEDCLRRWLPLLARPIKDRLRVTGTQRWVKPEPSATVRELASRLQALTRRAAQMHRPERLVEVERALAFATRGHTAGEAALIERIVSLSDPELEGILTKLPPGRSHWDGIEARLTGVILFGPRA